MDPDTPPYPISIKIKGQNSVTNWYHNCWIKNYYIWSI